MPTITQQAQETQDKADILAIFETIQQAHHDQDGAPIVAQYTSDAAIFSLAPPLAHTPDGAATQGWLDSWAGPVGHVMRDVEITVNGDLAFCHGFLHLEGTKKGADRLVSFWMRETVCLQREGDGWKIVHEHSSVPFYMDGPPRAAFDLVP